MLFAKLSVILSLCAAITYSLARDWPRTIYWLAAAVLTVATLRMR